VADRYEPRELATDGWGVWDRQQQKRVEQPGLRDSHWWPRRDGAARWAARENADYSSRKRRQSGTSSA
jgi:hypothetical protein